MSLRTFYPRGRAGRGEGNASSPFTIVTVTAVCVLLISSCTSMPPLPSSPFRLKSLDTSAVRGKIIVIDPGHGGRFGGAVGTMGLKESEVNLGVALYLWGLLDSAGARPLLTRTADTAVAPGSTQQLGDDLLARSRLSNRAGADLFVSIHHNSDTADPRKNDLTVFYKLADPGASQELAESVMARLTEGFDARRVKVLPGNFSVLRKTEATAILGEASYLTNRENERRLSLHGFLKMEAEAYFAGILDYCKRGIPVVSEIYPQGGVLEEARPVVWARIADNRQGIDPASIRLYLDGVVVGHAYEPESGLVSYIPSEPLANREHTVRLEAKNMGGNSAPPGRVVFRVSCPPASIECSALPVAIPPDGASRCRVTARVLDNNRNPVADGTPVSFSASAGQLVEAVVETRRGKAITHLLAGAEPGEAQVTVWCGTASASHVVSFASPGQGLMEIAVHDPLGAPVGHAELVCGKEHRCVTDRLGYCFVQSDAVVGEDCTVWKDGYRPARGVFNPGERIDVRRDVVLHPVDGGLLWGKVIMIDPRGEEGDGAAADSREKRRLEDNREVALRVEEMFRLAGAQVVLTREPDTPVSPAELVLKSEAVRPHLLISLDHAKRSGIGYYFNSSKGRMLAGSLRQFMSEAFSCKNVALVESTDFLIVHTSMPAVTVSFGSRGCKKMASDKEARMWKEAEVVFQAVRSYFMGLPRPEAGGGRGSDVD